MVAAIQDLLPYSSHVTTGIIKLVGGDYMATWQLKGYPFVGQSADALSYLHGSFNRLLQGLRAPDNENVAFYTHEIRRSMTVRLTGKFDPGSFAEQLDQKYSQRVGGQKMRMSDLYLTMIYRPQVKAGLFSKKGGTLEEIIARQEESIKKMVELCSSVSGILSNYGPRSLGIYQAADQPVPRSELIEFLGYLLNHEMTPQPVLGAQISNYLARSRHIFGNNGIFVIKKQDDTVEYGAMLNIKEYPNGSFPGILNGLKYLDIDYVITQSFAPKSRHDALKYLDQVQRQMISSEDKSISQINELTQAMDGVASGHYLIGEYHFTIAAYADSKDNLINSLSVLRSVLTNAGFVVTKEEIALAANFYSQLPGNWRYRPRIANLSSKNFLGLSPMHNFAEGKMDNNPWGECVTMLQTTNGQPYYFNFHATNPGENSFGEKALGNTMVIGKSGTGKTALINFLLAQTQKYQPRPTIFFFDKDNGAEIFVRAMGGRYLAIRNGEPSGFNPFQCDATPENEQFLIKLIKMLAEKDRYTASEEEDIAKAVKAILDTPPALRTMTNFRKSLPNFGDDSIYAKLRKWCQGGGNGWVFDNPTDQIIFDDCHIFGFDYTEFLDNDEVRGPIIAYLIHRMESLIDGRPFIYVMDEFWKILEEKNSQVGELAQFAKDKQKTIRKQNGLGIFATQSPEDALKSPISRALIEQTATFILLPNSSATRSDYVEGLKLTDAEFNVIQSLDDRSRSFVIKQGHYCAICKLDLNGMNEELSVISASTEDVILLNQIIAEMGTNDPSSFMPRFFEAKQLRQKSS